MVQINFALKEVNCKIVYYGPGLSGKTTNLEIVHQKAPGNSVGNLTSIATEGDRTLFFDFLPLNLGQVAGMKTKFQIYTVPGQVYYNSTRKLVLQGADGVVFVADSKRGKMDENIESLGNLQENLKEHGLDISGMPIVLQYNKRDLADVYSVEELEEALNSWEAPHFEAVARDGQGVFPTLKRLAGMVLESLNDQHAAKRSSSIAISRDRRPAIAHSGSAATAVASPAAPVAASERTGTSRVSLTADASTAPATRVRTMVQEVPARPVAAGPRSAISTSPRRRKRRAGLLLGLLFATAITATVLLHLAGVIRILP
jgi:signal recognition particle receptor subunit beta